ncbi:DUF305 domain-containing protein [Hymenobacter sp. 15J16-1T3B]|uniref:DUF305 domain-containing protein n=1 Tax=Hymenobacter sp. 15J16-1T3B TaxID=2886941 RepID=UPI001D11BAC6|nr:DUF305 domain-containing protein [Hymenobacter sp. 15J16-1T3B]MCC3160226.1 DUF305 domain-containing protein [Hymenobacter sp. 15J16-1T3B]
MLRSLRLPLLACLLAFTTLTACNKDDSDGLKVQAHDDNVFMRMMHDMMTQMMAMTKTQDPDNDFAMMMKMHHQGAITMSQEELRSGKDADMKQMAQTIITKQQAEIQQLDAFLSSHPAHAPAVPAFNTKQMESMERMMQANDLRPLTGDIDYDFAQLMVDHHRSAIENSQAEIEYGRENAMKTLAHNIIDDQEMEIKDLQAWLLAHKKF